MFKVYQKLKLLCAELKVLNRRDFGLISERISQTRESLKESQRSLLNDPFNGDLQRKEKNLLTELQRMLLWEESLLKQKSRCQWVNLGDQNSRFFFNIL